jgi:hypothetical protein
MARSVEAIRSGFESASRPAARCAAVAVRSAAQAGEDGPSVLLCGLIHRGGREAQKADDVAGREDMRLGGPVVGVDGESTPLIRP